MSPLIVLDPNNTSFNRLSGSDATSPVIVLVPYTEKVLSDVNAVSELKLPEIVLLPLQLNNVTVVDMSKKPYKTRLADLWKCPKCGYEFDD